jgi:molybdate transport system substrate-binding protein
MVWLAVVSLLILAGLGFLLYRESQPAGNASPERPLKVYCAAALKPVMQTIAAEYEKEMGRKVEFEFGDSGTMLGNVTLRRDGDLFLPADDSFVNLALERGLVAETFPLCRMRAVILARFGNPGRIATFEDLMKKGLKIGIANPDKAAIGKVVRQHLIQLSRWDRLAGHLEVQFATVTDSANAVQLGSIDAAIVWDSVAINYPKLTTVRVAELDGAVGSVQLAVLGQAPEPAAARSLARYTAAGDRGLLQFRKAGFTEVEAGIPWVVRTSGGDTP